MGALILSYGLIQKSKERKNDQTKVHPNAYRFSGILITFYIDSDESISLIQNMYMSISRGLNPAN